MEIRKIVRKATAIAASASFIGATMLGAVAQDLANYPSPFVKDGQFDAFIVVGANAQPEDVIGAVDVGASLQFALKKTTAVSAGAAEATIDTGVKVQKTGNKFNYNDSINSVQAGAFSQDELPTILGDGKYVESEGNNKNSQTYTQNLRFNKGTTAQLEYAQDDDLAPKASDYLFIDKNTELYNYTLEFDSQVDYDNSSSQNAKDDFKTTALTMQGKVYTITDVSLQAGKINKMTLLAGESVLWLTQNNPITKTVGGVEHTIEVLDVTDAADACQVKVDDVTAIIDVDNTKTVNGVQIGVTDVRAIHAQLQDVDVCQISIGASQIELESGSELKVDDSTLDGSKAIIGDTGGNLNSIQVTYQPSDQNDDVYLSSGKEFIDPVFKSWKVVYGGLTADYETYTVKNSAEDGKITFMNNDGKTVEIPYFLNATKQTGARVMLGTGNKVDAAVIFNGTGIGTSNQTPAGRQAGSDRCVPSSLDVTDCEGVMVLAATTNGEAHMFRIDNIDVNKNQTDIKDLTYGRTFNNVDFSKGQYSSLNLGSFGTIELNISAAQIQIGNSVKAKIETHAGGSLNLTDDNNLSIQFSEQNRNGGNDIGDEQTAATNISVIAKPSSDGKEIDLTTGLGTVPVSYSVDSEHDSDFRVRVTGIGTIVTSDDNNFNDVKIMMPKSEVFGNVFIAPIVAQVSTATGGVPTYTLSKLNVGAAKLDSEISDASANNLIIVGGPCANRLAATVLGKTFPACGADSGIAADTAVIKEVAQSSGKVALVVAGYNAVDTRRATRVLANYDTFALSGSSVTVTGTSLTDIKVTKSA